MSLHGHDVACDQPISSVLLPKTTLDADSLVAATKEENRLGALYSLSILDTPPEPEFDDFVQMATAVCGTPIGMISFVDEDRQWFKSSLGMEVAETPRNVAFCHHAIQQPDLMLVEDAQLDPRFCAHPMVTGTEGWRFYAGMPLESPEGHALGTLCVLDRVPRTLSFDQKAALRILARQVNARLELRAQRRDLEKALQRAEAARLRAEALEQRFRTFMDSGPFLAYMKDGEGRMLYYNQPMAKQFNVSLDAMLDKTDAELWPPELAESYRQHDLEVFRAGHLQICHEKSRNPDGTTSVLRSYKFPCCGPDGQALLGGISVEVTEELQRQEQLERYQRELERVNQRLNELASVDALTGLANRRVFDEQLRLAFRRARQDAAPLSLLMLDVDHFKAHNDRFGHSHGDNVLRELASCLRATLRRDDLAARYGGEEFVVLLPDASALQAAAIAAALLQTVRHAPWPAAPVTISIGVGTLTPATRDPQHFLGRADEALYAAKCQGRDRVVSFDDELKTHP